ncbi:hypothetical protein [Streptomyces sp. NPDC001933]|uniref:hypothetical protein n=1 Tax=Streptomyces sp. NPDC001933 TaxID=3364626 RepID=UPI0036BAF0E4
MAGVIIVASAISAVDDDAPSTARDVPSASTGIDDADDPPLTDEDGSVGESKRLLALDLAWLSMTNADRREMCRRYQADPDEAVSALLNAIEESDSLSPAQAHELFSTNCT